MIGLLSERGRVEVREQEVRVTAPDVKIQVVAHDPRSEDDERGDDHGATGAGDVCQQDVVPFRELFCRSPHIDHPLHEGNQKGELRHNGERRQAAPDEPPRDVFHVGLLVEQQPDIHFYHNFIHKSSIFWLIIAKYKSLNL